MEKNLAFLGFLYKSCKKYSVTKEQDNKLKWLLQSKRHV